jgi:hypothetical protein
MLYDLKMVPSSDVGGSTILTHATLLFPIPEVAIQLNEIPGDSMPEITTDSDSNECIYSHNYAS